MSESTSTLLIQDPDSLEDEAQEPGDGATPPVEDSAEEVAEEVPSAADDAAADSQPDDGPARDANGRFVSTKVEAETPAPVVGSIAPEPVPATPAEPSPPFSFRVDGVAVEVEGATRTPDGKILLSQEAWDRHVSPRLVDRRTIHRREQAQLRRIAELESEAKSRDGDAKIIVENVDALLSDRDGLVKFIQNYDVEAPKLKLKIQNQILESKLKRHETRLTSHTQEADLREFTEIAKPGLSQAVSMIADELAKGAPVDSNALADELWDLSETGVPIFFEVKEGDGSGLDPREHKWGVNLALLRKLVAPRVRTAQAAAANQKAAEVAKANQQALGKTPARKAPPTVPAAASPTPGGEVQVPKTREEYLAMKAKRNKELNLPD